MPSGTPLSMNDALSLFYEDVTKYNWTGRTFTGTNDWNNCPDLRAFPRNKVPTYKDFVHCIGGGRSSNLSKKHMLELDTLLLIMRKQ